MAKTKVSLTLDAAAIEELARSTGADSLSAAVTGAVAEKLERLRQRLAIQEWIREWEESNGEIPETAVAPWEERWRKLGA